MNAALRRDIEKDIKGDLKGDFERLMIALLQASREDSVDRAQAEQDVEELLDAGERLVGCMPEARLRYMCRTDSQ